jgi:hypothetical protein
MSGKGVGSAEGVVKDAINVDRMLEGLPIYDGPESPFLEKQVT